MTGGEKDIHVLCQTTKSSISFLDLTFPATLGISACFSHAGRRRPHWVGLQSRLTILDIPASFPNAPPPCTTYREFRDYQDLVKMGQHPWTPNKYN